MMITINRSILNFFIEKNRLSAARLYFFVKHQYNNHLHIDDFAWIKDQLNISERVIRKNLQQLQELGVCSYYSKHYWRFNSYKNFAYSKVLRKDKISLKKLRSIKFLRTLYYKNLYDWAYKMSRKNAKEQKGKLMSSFAEVSSSFVQSVTGTERSQCTLLKHLKRAEGFGLVKVRRKCQEIAFSTKHSDLLKLSKTLKFPTVIKRYRGIFYLLSFFSNKVSFKFNTKYKYQLI